MITYLLIAFFVASQVAVWIGIDYLRSCIDAVDRRSRHPAPSFSRTHVLVDGQGQRQAIVMDGSINPLARKKRKPRKTIRR